MLVATMTGITNGLLAGTFRQQEARDYLQHAVDLSIPSNQDASMSVMGQIRGVRGSIGM